MLNSFHQVKKYGSYREKLMNKNGKTLRNLQLRISLKIQGLVIKQLPHFLRNVNDDLFGFIRGFMLPL